MTKSKTTAWAIMNMHGEILSHTVHYNKVLCRAALVRTKHNQTWGKLEDEGYRIVLVEIREL